MAPMNGSGLVTASSLSTGLIYVEKDKQWERVPVTGRYDCERDEWLSVAHRKACILGAWESMVDVQEKQGSTWDGATPQVAGPLQHIDFSGDTTPDTGPMANRPDPRDRDANDRWEAAEKAKAARRSGVEMERVDFTLTAGFKRRVRNAFRVHIPESR